MNRLERRARVIVYGQHIDEQHIGNQTIVYNCGTVPADAVVGQVVGKQFAAEQKTACETEKAQHQQTTVDCFSREALQGYIDAGYLKEDLMPTERLSRGEKAVLAEHIAKRLKMVNYWPSFEKFWGLNACRSDCSRFKKTKKYTGYKEALEHVR